MPRPLSAAAMLYAASTALALAACNAGVDTGCLGGQCNDDAGMGTGTGGGGLASSCGPGPATGDFPCETFTVVHHRCNPCHTDPPVGGAPFPLLTYEDTQQPVSMFDPTLRFIKMDELIHPNGSPRMPFGGMLDAADLATLAGWLEQCAPPLPEGTGCECTTPTTGMGCD